MQIGQIAVALLGETLDLLLREGREVDALGAVDLLGDCLDLFL